ncbi:MAG: DNA polymerase III subunit epsilon [Pseudomonadota bacterium]|nr:DNA polymerase III subunit epsilon [Pseudomonadota bacterium]
MRQIVLDTETTGLDPAQGHRVIEIGAIEVLNRRVTDNRFHCYLQPDRAIDPAAIEVHGITDEMLADKPRFADIAGEFLGFVQDAELIIHNAAFDVAFLNHELELLGKPRRMTDYCTVLDTLTLARQLHPGQKNSLDALCRRYGVDNSQRTLHGALLDAEILADVYLAMTGGQVALTLEAEQGRVEVRKAAAGVRRDRRPLRVVAATAEEQAAHAAFLDAVDKSSGGGCLWKSLPEGE